MIKLLNAGFTRLLKSKTFWVLILFSVGLALFMINTSYGNMKKFNDVIEIEQIMLNYATMIGIVVAIFTSLFLGVEYSDGGMRNKISIGHKRVNIYLSNLIITTLTSLFSYILFLIVVAITGIPLFGAVSTPASSLAMLIGSIFFTTTAYSSIFTFIGMMISNKTITAIVNIMVAFGLMMMALVCLNILSETEFIRSAEITDMETGEYRFVEEPNPHYPSDEQRKMYQTLLDINPAGQMFQLAGRAEPNLKVLPLYSVGILVVFTSMGLILFKKKDLT